VPGYVVVLLHSAPDVFGDCTIVSALELYYRIALAVLTPHVVVEEIARFAKHVYYDVRLDVVYFFKFSKYVGLSRFSVNGSILDDAGILN